MKNRVYYTLIVNKTINGKYINSSDDFKFLEDAVRKMNKIKSEGNYYQVHFILMKFIEYESVSIPNTNEILFSVNSRGWT